MLLTSVFYRVAFFAIAICFILAIVRQEFKPEGALRVQLFKQMGEHGSVEVQPGGSILPGDELYMTVEVRQSLHVYVVSEDQANERLLIYPCQTWGRSPRFAPGQSYRLPGREGFWPVRSVTPRERLLVIASSHPIGLLDAVFGAEENPLPCAAPVRGEANRWIQSLIDPSGLSWGSLPKWKRSPETWISTLDLKGILGHA